MGNRLTLPLLLLAALLAGGAFFWMTGGERAVPATRGVPAADAVPGERSPAELAEPARVEAESAAPTAPARVELAKGSAPAPASATKASGASVRGRVVDRFGTPIPGARVIAAADTGFPIDLGLEREFPWLKRQRTETDADGRFRFEEVEPGSMQVAVRASGFAPLEQRGVSVAAGGSELADLVLARGAILSGIVVDPEGRPVPAAKILRTELEDGGLFLVGEREPLALSGSDGRFRVDQLACGAWRFLVRSEDHPDLTVEGLAEEPGVEQGGLRWQLAPGATIAGTVTAVPNGERGLLEVRAVRAGGAEGFPAFGAGRTAEVAANGSFLVRGLEVGASYSLQARQARSEDERSFWERSRSERVQAHAGDSGVVLAYQPEAAVTFTVFDAGTRLPLEEFQVESGLEWAMPLRDDDGRPRTRFPGGVARVGGLRPGSDQQRVQLTVKATGYAEYRRDDIAVRAGQELDLGALYLDPVPLVRVRVLDQDGAPVADASVHVQKQASSDALEIRHSISIGEEEGVESIDFGEGRRATTDAQGWAAVTSYEGETVDVSARAKGFAPAKLSDVVLPRGKTVEHELRLTRGGEVLVRVLDNEDRPVAGARVERRQDDGGPPGGRIIMGGPRAPGQVTDSAGEVRFENLAPGEHSFRLAESNGGGPMFAAMDSVVIAGLDGDGGEEWSQVQVEEAAKSELVLRAAPRAELVGRVREAGKVLAGATLRLAKENAEPRLAIPGMSSGPEAKSDGEGRYEIADVKEGIYTLVVEHPTRRMPQEFELELREGENTFDVELPLSILTGRIVDVEGKGLAGVRVWPERREPDSGRRQYSFRMVMMDDSGGGVVDSGQFGERALTDEHGDYTLRGVASDTDLVVKAEGDAVQPGESSPVRVAPDQVKKGLDLTLEPAGSIRVEATQADGSPARFQLVQATYVGDEQPPPEPKFSFLQQGSTELKGLKPGPWRVNVRNANDGPRASGGQDKEIVVEPGVTTPAAFEVE